MIFLNWLTSKFKRGSVNSVKAVYEDDLKGYLDSLGIYDDVITGKMRCIFCGNKITLETLELIIPEDRKIILVCSQKNCMNQL